MAGPDAIKRKKVVRVGSGAHSIYLPKKWVDDWLPAQRQESEVDLHRINQSILVVPVIQDRTATATIASDVPAVLRHLLAAYVQGHDTVRLRPAAGRFDNDCVATARDILHRLDERLVAVVSATELGFDLRPGPPAIQSGADLLSLLAARVREMVDLAGESVDTYAVDPDRCLHAAKLLCSTHQDDVSRLFHQSLRLVARLELPLDTVSDFQVLDLTAADYYGMGRQAVEAIAALLSGYGLKLEDLAYPRADLVRRTGGRPPEVSPIGREILQGYRRAFHDVRGLLDQLAGALARRDGAALAAVHAGARAGQQQVQQRIFETIMRHWGAETSPAAAQASFIIYQVSQALVNLLASIAEAAGHGQLLVPMAGKPQAAHAPPEAGGAGKAAAPAAAAPKPGKGAKAARPAVGGAA